MSAVKTHVVYRPKKGKEAELFLAHTTPEIMAVWGPMTPLLESLEISVLEAAT